MKWRDVAAELEGRPGYREAFELQFPYANVALAVVALRERHGLTQRALAELVGTPQPVIARLESGRHPVEVRLLARVANAVGETWTVQFEPRANVAVARAATRDAILGPEERNPIAPQQRWRGTGR